MKGVTLSRRDRWGVHFEWPRVLQALTWKENGNGLRVNHNVKPEALRARLLAGTGDLWTAPQATFPTRLSSAIVTTIAETRQGKVLRVEVLASCNFGTWIKSAACTLSAFALANGCKRLILVGPVWFRWYYFRQHFDLPVTWIKEDEKSADHHHHNVG